MKTSTLLVSSLAVLAIAAGTTQAAIINATSNAADGWFDLAGTVNTTTRLFAGPLGVPNETRNGMAVFALPNIPAGDTVISAKLSLNLYDVNLQPGMGVDVYAMRVSNLTAYGIADHYGGAFPGIGNAAGNGAIGIQDDLMSFATLNNQPPLGVYSTGAAANAALGAYLQSNAYSSLSGTPSSTYILLRINHDFNPPLTTFELARFTATEGVPSGPIPVLELTTAPAVPEPASALLCMVAAGLVVLRCRYAGRRTV